MNNKDVLFETDDFKRIYKIAIKHGLKPASMSDKFVVGFIQTLQSALEFKRMYIKYFKDNNLYFGW